MDDMTALATHSRLRWGVPVAAAVLLAGAGPLINTVTASAHGSLAPRSAAQLLVDVQQAKVQGLSGTVVQTSNLGLPSLPSFGGAGGGGVSFSSLVSGSHTMRLWYAGPTQVRVALLGQLGESDLIRNGSDAWSWSSSSNTATHYAVPTDAGGGAESPVGTPGTTVTPQQAAQQALKAIDPTTRVTTDPTAVVAGRSAYELVLAPRDARSLVGTVRIAIDGKTHIPTRVQVFARGASSPAFEVGFTSFSTATPPASTFAFSPPPGAIVKQGDAPSVGHTSGPGKHASTGTHVVGNGWTSVVVTKAPAGASGQQSSLAGILKHLPAVSGSWGSGHLLQGALFSALLTDQGQLVVGAVAPSQLYAALGRS
jgi:outer membrane lipoprotein-sorting protein